MRTDYAVAKDENTAQSKELINLRHEVEKLTIQLRELDSQNKSSDIASTQYQMLLDMALEKLR